MSDFKTRFNVAIQAKGISRRELGRLSGVHVNTLNNWAGGDVPNPHPKQLKMVAPYLGVSYEWLRTGEGAMPPGREPLRASENLAPGEPYNSGDGNTFDHELMEQVVRLVEDYSRLFRQHLDEARRVEMMERSYQLCIEAGFSGRRKVTMSQFQELVKGI